MNLEFSLVCLVLLLMLFVPNLLWSRYLPKDYEKYSGQENRILLAMERIGEVSVSALSLFCGVNFSFNLILFIVFLLMIIYELCWIRYFRSSRTMHDMYDDLLFVPLPKATLPVMSFFLLGICANNIFLVMASIVLGIGHIGIHFAHKKEINN